MAISFDGMSKEYESTLENVNYVFTAIFIVEAALKLIG